MGHIQWIALLAIVVGGVVRALKSDGATALLSRLAGRDLEAGDEPIKLPTRALPWLALGLAALSAGLDGLVEGKTFEESAYAAVVAAAGAVFGHELLSGVPGVKKLLQVGLVAYLAGANVACTPEARWAAIDAAADLALCAIRNSHLPDEEMFLMCGAKTLEDRDRLRTIAGEHRAGAAREATAAADRARDEAMRAAAAGKAGACGPEPRPIGH